MTNIIELKKIVKTYHGHDVVKSIDLSIEKGSFNWIVGHSGSGKTTLLNMMSGLDTPSSGTILINGVDVSTLSEKEKAVFRSVTLGFVFQFHYLLPELTAYENVLIPLQIQKKKITKDIKKNVLDLLASVGVSHVLKQYPKSLSGGEQQRVAVARAIVHEPLLIMADEPTGNLDSKSAESVYEVMRYLHQNKHTTFIIVTHDRIRLEKGDRVITLKDGSIIKDETHA